MNIAMALPTVDIVIPVRNEERCLEQSVRRLHAELQRMTTFAGRIIIADNDSTDGTPRVAQRLSGQLEHVMMLRLEQAGRGRALRRAWMTSNADVVVYMDADLSTDLAGLPIIVDAVASGAADVAVGSRLARGARVRRSLRREVISRCYNALLRRLLHLDVHDAQCGFKALRTSVARRLIPLVGNQNWFFDTELLVAARRSGATVLEVPVTWTEDPNSSVAIVRTAVEDLRGIMRLRREMNESAPPPLTVVDQLLRFALIGIVSTGAYVALFDLLRGTAPAQLANAVALMITAAGNTAVNRRFTFGLRGRVGRLRTFAVGAATVMGFTVLRSCRKIQP